jgi:acetylornithine/succinyldiaminopimelate/putrescine aminotransferase
MDAKFDGGLGGEILRKGFEEYRAWVNPLIANRADLAGEPVRMARAEGGALIDDEGRRYEDFHGTQAFGHRNPAITAAVRAFLESDAPSWYPSRVNPFTGRLARRLCERTGYSNAYFGMSGSDAVEAALKLARAATRRPRLLGLERAYHGCGMGACALMAPGALHDPFGPHVPGVEVLPFGDTDALARAVAPGDVAAVIVEPVQGEGGVRPLPAPYIDALCELTERHGTLLVADEVQTGLGRSGAFLATASWPRRPDCVLLAKALAGGITPMSAMLTRRELFERAYGASFEAAEAHNSTFSNNALGAVAALAALDLLTDEVISRVRDDGEAFRRSLAEALGGSSLFSQVRGAGFMIGIELRQPDHPWVSFEQFGYPDLAERATIGPLLAHRLYRRGYFAFVCGHDWSVLRLQPRFTIESTALADFTRACREELAHLEELV